MPINEDHNYMQQEDQVINLIKEKWNNDKMWNSFTSTRTLIKLTASLKTSMGHDGIHPELIRRASTDFLDNLVVFMNACSKYCHLPDKLLKGINIPIVKRQ